MTMALSSRLTRVRARWRAARNSTGSTVWNALSKARPKMSASKGLVRAPFLYAWVSEDECAPDLRGHQSRLRPTAIPPALECRSAARFTPRLGGSAKRALPHPPCPVLSVHNTLAHARAARQFSL